MISLSTYEGEFERRVADVFRANPTFYDHRAQHLWLRGWLGDPHCGIYFIAENPSLRQVERARNPDGGPPTPEAQWWASEGDKLFREALLGAGFKNGPVDAIGGWNCYVTNVIKEADRAKLWEGRPTTSKQAAAVAWSSLLQWEIDMGQPRLVVTMGGRTRDRVRELVRTGRLRVPVLDHVVHFSYVAMRPGGGLPRMHPDRVAAYMAEFVRLAERLRGLS